MESNKLVLNSMKTKYMLFHKHNKVVPTLELKINDSSIDQVSTFNCLGLHINSQLTWQTHIDEISKKISRVIDLIYKLQYILPQKILLTLYNTLILPQINYCILLCGKESKSILLLQKRAIRAVSSAGIRAHSEPLFKIHNVLKFDDISQQCLLVFYYNVVNNIISANFNDFLPVLSVGSHTYPIRNPQRQLPKHSHEYIKLSCRYQLTILSSEIFAITGKYYNTIIAGIFGNVRHIPVVRFKRYIKTYFLKKYSYLCGDYNIDILKICSNNHYNTFYENVMSCCFVPKITLPTRICGTASTLIDNIYTNVLDKSHTSGILIRPLSDHQMYFCVMNENYVKPTTKQKYIEVEVFNEENIESFRKEIADLEIHNKLDDSVDRDPNYNYEIVSTLLQNAKSKHIPKRIKKFNKRRHKKERWMTDELLAQVIKKNDMYVDWKTTPITHPDYEQVKLKFKGYEKIVSKGIDKAKKDYFDRVFVAYKSDMKKTWQVISETLSRNKKSHEMLSVFNHEGHELADSVEIANAFNTYFANIGKNLSSQIDQSDTNADYKLYLTSPTEEKMRFKCITTDYTMKAIEGLESKKSSGHDGISNTLLKVIKASISQSLTIIINQMLTTGIFPDAFKVSKVNPLYKKGDSSLLVNYRPISLLPTISKIFEKVIHDHWNDYFDKYNLLAEQQYGFRKRHSTEYAAVKLIDHVSKEMENGKTPTNVYIDLSKAFDTLTFDILLFKLKYYGVTDTALDLMRSYLTNRKQYVVFNGCQSDYSEIYTG